MLPEILDIYTLRQLYLNRNTNPATTIEAVIARCDSYPDKTVWISRVDPTSLRQSAEKLSETEPSPEKPLWGIPFAVKDNIDCENLPTTAGCPEFSYQPARDAAVVARLKAAGAILIGKTNLDQFATGLTGTRSPYGSPHSVFSDAFISGGSSSGSAVAVSAGLVAFALGTDTAGSGRIPAAFNNIVGIKPSKGLLSTQGMVPACRSLDCVSIFSATVGDGALVQNVIQFFDNADPYSRDNIPKDLPDRPLRIGVLSAEDRVFFGDTEYEELYDSTIKVLRTLGVKPTEFDYTPFRKAAALLYEGPWIAERMAAIASFMTTHENNMEPTVREIIVGGRDWSAIEAFQGQYLLQDIRRQAEAEWDRMDVMLLPTAPTTYTIQQVQNDPVKLNARLGTYTNFVNLLDCSAIAVPAGFRGDGIPFGVTLVAPAFYDGSLALLADRLHRQFSSGMGKSKNAIVPEMSRLDSQKKAKAKIDLFVVGAHLSGMPLNHQLNSLNATFLRETRTAADYKFYALAGTNPAKPGLIRKPGFCGPGILGEVWALDANGFGEFVNAIPAPLGIGKIELEDGSIVSGFLCEQFATESATEITQYGGWRAYIASKSN